MPGITCVGGGDEASYFGRTVNVYPAGLYAPYPKEEVRRKEYHPNDKESEERPSAGELEKKTE